MSESSGAHSAGTPTGPSPGSGAAAAGGARAVPAAGYGDDSPEARAERESVGDLLGQVSRDVSTLMRQEVELAKAELRESARDASKGAAMFAGAAVAAHFTVLFLSIALWYALGYLVGLGWSGVIVAVIWAVIAAVLFSVGRARLKAVRGMPQTAATVKEIPETLKPGEDRP